MPNENRDEPFPPGCGTSGARGLGATVVALTMAIGALIALALATSSDEPAGREPPGSAPAMVPATGRRGGIPEQIQADLREGNRLIDTPLDSKLAQLKGVPVVVNQWASWCPPCRAEFRFFAELSARYERRVAFLGLNSRDARGPAEEFLREHPVNYPSVFDERGEQARSIGAGVGWPTTVFFDADGEAVFIRRGAYVDAAALEADIREHALGIS